jgi:hypothetical protein
MRLTILFGIFFSLLSWALSAQNKEDYYYQIPEYPNEYTAGNVAARMIDGLGFRYYWATADLRASDMMYRPSDEARTSRETLDHIYGLSLVIVNSTNKLSNKDNPSSENLSFEELRNKTLENFKDASIILKNSSSKDLESYAIVFEKIDGSSSTFPFWNQINGPIADALWHVGQVISFRRTSGNPYNSKASMLRGKVRE